jgi:hypothetical protein
VKRPLPLWLAAVVPATLAGHGLAYALAKESTADGRHAWMVPALECSLALLVAVFMLRAGQALLRAHILVHTSAERSCLALWPRLALTQMVLFYVMERGEGSNAGVAGAVVQIAVALLAAYILSLFARVLGACALSAERAIQYLARLLNPVTSFISPGPAPIAHALAIHAGTARFQRPPPQF